MIKTVTIDNKDVRLDNNIGWAMQYRNQFGRDIIPALMPLVAGAVTVIGGIIDEIGAGKEVDATDIIKALNGETLAEAVIQASQLELVDFINVVWALAKHADETIPEPMRWVRQFESFPMDELVPVVASLIIKGASSSKNWGRLQTWLESLRPKQ